MIDWKRAALLSMANVYKTSVYALVIKTWKNSVMCRLQQLIIFITALFRGAVLQ